MPNPRAQQQGYSSRKVTRDPTGEAGHLSPSKNAQVEAVRQRSLIGVEKVGIHPNIPYSTIVAAMHRRDQARVEKGLEPNSFLNRKYTGNKVETFIQNDVYNNVIKGRMQSDVQRYYQAQLAEKNMKKYAGSPYTSEEMLDAITQQLAQKQGYTGALPETMDDYAQPIMIPSFKKTGGATEQSSLTIPLLIGALLIGGVLLLGGN